MWINMEILISWKSKDAAENRSTDHMTWSISPNRKYLMIWDLVKEPWQAKTNILTNVTVVCRGTPPRKEGEGLEAVCQTSRRSSGGDKRPHQCLTAPWGRWTASPGWSSHPSTPSSSSRSPRHPSLCTRNTSSTWQKNTPPHLADSQLEHHREGASLPPTLQDFHLPLGGRQLIPNTGYIKPILTRDPQVLFIKISCWWTFKAYFFLPELSPSSDTDELTVSSSSVVLPSWSGKSTSISSWLESFFSLEWTGIVASGQARAKRWEGLETDC